MGRKKENKNVQILSIEAKDLLTKRYEFKDGTIFKGSLDDSMEVDKLRKLSKKIIKFDKKRRRFYTTDIITVTFKYSCNDNLTDEESERVKNLEMALYIKQEELKSLKNKNIDKEEKAKQMKKCKEEINYIKELIKIASQNINRKELRELAYKDGFNIIVNGKVQHYVRYKRSSGSARVGKCLFINEKYAKKMIDWSFAGIPHKKGQEMDCSAIESYISLPTSSCIDRFKLKPENILLIEDGKSTFEDTIMATRLVNEVYDEHGNIIDGDLETGVETTQITNTIWDGSSLLDKSVFEDNGYGDKGILQIRNMFFKGIGINTDIQRFFKDNNITEISQLNGQTLAKRVEDIKLITTPSSVKYLKYGSFEDWLKYLEEDWGLCKYEKPQKHFNGMVQTHYQLINTLGMDLETTREFLKDTIDYINLLKNDLGVFKYHLGLNLREDETKDYELKNIASNSDFILSMLNRNDDFAKTKICKKFREEIISNYIKNVRKGHVLVNGNYSVVVSCPYEYLKASIGKWNGESSLKPFECVSSKFDEGDEILGVRSPQPTMSNMSIFKNTKNKYIEKYFNTRTKEVIYISAIGNNVFEMQSSMDTDGDQMMLTNNKYIVSACKKFNDKVNIGRRLIDRFLVPNDFTSKTSIKKKYDWEDLADTDIKNSSNKIGEIINLAQMLNSLYWDKKTKGASEEELFELYKDICQLDILSCIEIDRCKKLSPVNAVKELKKIRDKGYFDKGIISRNKEKKSVGIRPYFFKFLDGGKDYKFQKYNCGMDNLEIILDKTIKKKIREDEILNLIDIISKPKICKVNRNQIDKIIKILKHMRYEQNKVWISSEENKWELSEEIYAKHLEEIKSLNIKQGTIYIILKRINDSYTKEKFKEYRNLGRSLLRILYTLDSKSFLETISPNINDNENIIEDEKGDIEIYRKSFKKFKNDVFY